MLGCQSALNNKLDYFSSNKIEFSQRHMPKMTNIRIVPFTIFGYLFNIYNFQNQTLTLIMLQQLSISLNDLKKSTSLKYIDLSLREKTRQLLKTIIKDIPELQLCRQYITKMEEEHQYLLDCIGTFVVSFSQNISEYHHNYQSLQTQHTSQSKMHQIEKKQWNNSFSELIQRLQATHQQIFNKQQEIRELLNKLDQKDAFIEQLQRQSTQYLKKVQYDMEKQQKALQQYSQLTYRLEQQLNFVRKENRKLQQSHLQQKQCQNRNNNINIVQFQVNRSQSSLADSPSTQYYQRVNISQIGDTEQFHLNDSPNKVNDQQFQPIPRSQTLKDILNISVQREYLANYNKCDMLQTLKSRQNKQLCELSISKQNSEGWFIMRSLQTLSKNSTGKLPIKQIMNKVMRCEKDPIENPYYFYFLIASQNAKIKSPFFEQICSINTDNQWQILKKEATPLHEWESSIQRFLHKQGRVN